MNLEDYNEVVCKTISERDPSAEVSCEFTDLAYEDGLTVIEAVESWFFESLKESSHD